MAVRSGKVVRNDNADEHAQRLINELNLVRYGEFDRPIYAPAGIERPDCGEDWKNSKSAEKGQNGPSRENSKVSKTSSDPAKTVKSQRPFKRCIRIFDPSEVTRIQEISKRQGKETRDRITASLKLVGKHDGYRRLPTFNNAAGMLDTLCGPFENFREVLDHYQEEMLLSGMMKPDGFKITPILLDGPPGVGKTAFAQMLAKIIGLPFRKISAGGMQHAALLTGTSSHWSNSETGEVFNMIASSIWACGVLLFDEADKISDRQDHAILPALLDLLEVETARNYVDESLGLRFDASRIFAILTSNDSTNMNDALRSRCRIFKIQEPGPQQKMVIAVATHDGINSKISPSKRIVLDMDAVEKLAEEKISTRSLIQAVRGGFSQALRKGKKISIPVLPQNQDEVETRQIGFL